MHRTLAPAMAILLLVSAALIGVTGCARPASPPPQAGPPPASPQRTAPPPDPSRPAITVAATALDERNPDAFAAALSEQLRQAVAGRLDLTGPGVPVLAKALHEAQLVAEYPTVRIYETIIDGEKHSFYAVQEEGQWRLAGL